jgi:hypothetical protein
MRKAQKHSALFEKLMAERLHAKLFDQDTPWAKWSVFPEAGCLLRGQFSLSFFWGRANALLFNLVRDHHLARANGVVREMGSFSFSSGGDHAPVGLVAP